MSKRQYSVFTILHCLLFRSVFFLYSTPGPVHCHVLRQEPLFPVFSVSLAFPLSASYVDDQVRWSAHQTAGWSRQKDELSFPDMETEIVKALFLLWVRLFL